MTGIKSIQPYIPAYRLPREVMAKAWGKKPALKGERSAANYDEDALTMGVEAALALAEEKSQDETANIDAVYFASTSAPYEEKLSSAMVAQVLGLQKNVFLQDTAHSLTSSTQALRSAFQSLKSGSRRNALVVASDQRQADPGSELEQIFGDGACAVLTGTDDLLLEFVDCVSLWDSVTDSWRKDTSDVVEEGDPVFASQYGYHRILVEVIENLLEANSLSVKEISRVIFPAPNLRDYERMARALGLGEGQYLQDGLLTSIGNAGCASVFLMLAASLESVKEGQLFLLANYGSGTADAFIFKATGKPFTQSAAVKKCFENRRALSSYEKFLSFKGPLSGEALSPFASQAMERREAGQNIGLFSAICSKCQTVYFPRKQVCAKCKTGEFVSERKLSREGVIYSYTKDILYPTPDLPNITAVCDLNGGGRFYGQVTDCDPQKIQIGMPVQLTFRKFHEGGGYYNYFWKIKPAEGGLRKGS